MSQAQHTHVHTYTGVDDVVGTACEAFSQLITLYAWTILPMIFTQQHDGVPCGCEFRLRKTGDNGKCFCGFI